MSPASPPAMRPRAPPWTASTARSRPCTGAAAPTRQKKQSRKWQKRPSLRTFWKRLAQHLAQARREGVAAGWVFAKRGEIGPQRRPLHPLQHGVVAFQHMQIGGGPDVDLLAQIRHGVVI